MTDEPSGKIVHFPVSGPTAGEVLRRTLANAERIKAVTVVIQWDDDTFAVDFSRQALSTICLGSMVLQRKVFKEIGGEG